MGSFKLFCCCILWAYLIIESDAKELINSCQCGVEASTNPLHYSPWLVLLEFYRRGQLTEFMCGGTLIDTRHVVTAAHCIRKIKHHRMLIRLGEYNLVTKVDCVDGVCADPIIRAGIEHVTVHPDYDGREHDIAIIRLKNEVLCTDFVRPICLPSVKLKSFAIFDAAGWGEDVSTGLASVTKKIIALPSWTYNDCRAVYKNDVIPSSVICAGGLKGMDTCRGDSGGPLAYQAKFAELYGVTSLGPTVCGSQGAPGIYTSVVDYLDWIREVLGVT